MARRRSLPPEARIRPCRRTLRVLVLTLGESRSRLGELDGLVIIRATDTQRGDELLACGAFDCVVIQASAQTTLAHLREALTWRARRSGAAHAAPVALVLHEQPTLDVARCAVQAGAGDVLGADAETSTLSAAIARCAAGTARQRRTRMKEARRARHASLLRDMLERSRRELAAQMGGVCHQLAGSYRDLADQLKNVVLASEFETLMRQELEVESLLRTTLEFLLRRIGPTNAAIFLPGSSGDFSLGAYVNYDCPRDSAEGMLESLCGALAPAFEHKPGLHSYPRVADLHVQQPTLPLWLGDHHLAVYSCVHEGECIAVIAVFREVRNGWSEEQVRTLGVMGQLFGVQLHRTIRTHHRHKQKDAWGAGEQDDGLAA
jgi:hypothetical protein